jgi:hypothetical protein
VIGDYVADQGGPDVSAERGGRRRGGGERGGEGGGSVDGRWRDMARSGRGKGLWVVGAGRREDCARRGGEGGAATNAEGGVGGSGEGEGVRGISGGGFGGRVGKYWLVEVGFGVCPSLWLVIGGQLESVYLVHLPLLSSVGSGRVLEGRAVCACVGHVIAGRVVGCPAA